MENVESSVIPNATDIREVVVKFVAHKSIPKEEIVEESIISLPAQLTRYGLSGVINHMLSQDPPRPYDILIDSILLRTSLNKYLIASGRSAEHTLVLEYLPAKPEPVKNDGVPHPDWVSSIDGTNSDYVLTGCYDGQLRLLSSTNLSNIELSYISSEAPIKCARWVTDSLLVSAGKDRYLRLHRLDVKPAVQIECIASGFVSDSIECLAVCGSQVVSGGWDGLNLWNLKEQTEKKRKVTTKELTAIKIVDNGSPEGETEMKCISTVCWPDLLALYSGSHDHTIKQWNLEESVAVRTWNSKKHVTSVDFSNLSNLIVSGHNDQTVRLWDPRTTDGLIVKQSFTSHSQWVSAVKWNVKDSNLFVSCSYDGTFKEWDIRSTVPLATVNAHSDKALCIDYHESSDKTSVLTGGADNQVQSFTL